jgi:hypothetical protein
MFHGVILSLANRHPFRVPGRKAVFIASQQVRNCGGKVNRAERIHRKVPEDLKSKREQYEDLSRKQKVTAFRAW